MGPQFAGTETPTPQYAKVTVTLVARADVSSSDLPQTGQGRLSCRPLQTFLGSPPGGVESTP